MRKDGKRYPSNVVKCCSFRAYLSNFRFDVFACLQEHTERKEVEKGARAEEDRNKAEAANGQKQADEEQEQKVTFESSAVPSVHTYRVYFSPTDRDGIFIFACSQERTKQEEAERRAPNTVEGRYLGLGTHRPKQADEEQQQNVTFQSSAFWVCQFCEYISL